MNQETSFGAVHRAMRRYVDDEILAGISSATLVGRDVVDLHCAGWADRERRVALQPDHIFRIFSNTKLVTSCAALLLLEEGRFRLDDPIDRFLPELGALRVLSLGAVRLEDTVPCSGPITVGHLFSHRAGFGQGLMDPGTLLFEAYAAHGVRDPQRTLAQMVQALSTLPLAFQPGSGWAYSMATDVLGRLIEVVSGESIDDHFQRRIFAPLGMTDTAFVLAPAQQERLVAIYSGASQEDPWRRGLTRCEDYPYPGAYLQPMPRLAAGGGLVSTLPDMLSLVRSLLPGGPTLLQPATIALLMSNRLPAGQTVSLSGLSTPGKGFGLAGAVTLRPSPDDPPESADEVEWGGVAGTHWWISPANNLAGVVMAQRTMAFWHPFSHEMKRLTYRAALHGGC